MRLCCGPIVVDENDLAFKSTSKTTGFLLHRAPQSVFWRMRPSQPCSSDSLSLTKICLSTFIGRVLTLPKHQPSWPGFAEWGKKKGNFNGVGPSMSVLATSERETLPSGINVIENPAFGHLKHQILEDEPQSINVQLFLSTNNAFKLSPSPTWCLRLDTSFPS